MIRLTYVFQILVSFFIPLFLLMIRVILPQVDEISIFSLLLITLISIGPFPILIILSMIKKSTEFFLRTLSSGVPLALAVWLSLSAWEQNSIKLVGTAIELEMAIDSYKIETNVYPPSIDELIPDYFTCDDHLSLLQLHNFHYFYNDTNYAFYYPSGMIDKSVWNRESDRFEYYETWKFK